MISITPMEKKALNDYSELYASVFNAEPWNDSWTLDSAKLRIESFMNDNSFFGMELRDGGVLKGIIFGQWEYYFDGKYFRIVEFCVRTSQQGRGFGKSLLSAFKEKLARLGAVTIFLITQHGERTEGWYTRQGFRTAGQDIIMNLSLQQGEQ